MVVDISTLTNDQLGAVFRDAIQELQTQMVKRDEQPDVVVVSVCSERVDRFGNHPYVSKRVL